MSFILDALRKSDARRQHSGAPGLNSPEPPQRPRRRRRLLPWAASILVLVAAVAAAVYVVRPDWLPPRLAGGPQPETAGQPAPPSGDASPEQAAGGDGPAQGSSNGPAGTPPSERRRQPEAQPDDATEQSRRQASEESSGESSEASSEESSGQATRDRRRPMPASPERTVRRESPQRESTPVPADEAVEELERRVAETRRRREAQPQEREESEDSTDASSQQQQRASDPRPEQDQASQPKPLNDGVAEYVRAWELPLSVRRSLPELNLSIHVYSPNESERFVLINGERYVAGDTIDDARIVDIRPDGAIVDYRSHRFLLEPR